MTGSSTSRAEFLHSDSPFANLPFASAPGRGVVASARNEPAIARMGARKGRLPLLVERMRELYGIELPQGPRRVAANGLAFVGVGVETWLAVRDGRPESDRSLNEFAASLRQALDESATVSEQNGAYAVLRLTGTRVRDTFAKFAPLDLHPRVFIPGSAASTLASHIPMTLWRLEDGQDGLPVFEIAVPRSYAGSFWHVVTTSAAEFGFVLE